MNNIKGKGRRREIEWMEVRGGKCRKDEVEIAKKKRWKMQKRRGGK